LLTFIFYFALPLHATMAQAVSLVPTTDQPPNTIVEVIRSGYMVKDGLLRAARVLVASVPPSLLGEDADADAEARATEEVEAEGWGGEEAPDNGEEPKETEVDVEVQPPSTPPKKE
jgi:hypothetical protein